MDAQMVVAAEALRAKRGFLGIALKPIRIPASTSREAAFLRLARVDGTHELRQVFQNEEVPVNPGGGSVTVFRVGLTDHPMCLSFSQVRSDSDGHQWDLRVEGTWSVADSRRFLNAYAADAVRPETPLSQAMAQSWMTRTVGPHVCDASQGHSIHELRVRDALPARWWQERLCEWLEEYGISIRVSEVAWRSAEAEAAEAEAARQRDLERVAQARQRERDAELREVAARAAYEKGKAEIESEQNLSERERTHQLQMLEKRHRKELLKADTEIENARREAEKATREHELTLARLRADVEAVKQVEDRDKEAEERHKAVIQELGDVRAALARLSDLPDNLLAQLADRDASKANEAAERVVSPEFGFAASTLARLGYRVERQSLVQYLRDKAACDGQQVTIQKRELITRDIGAARVKALPVNTSLQFEFTTARAGYVTLLNIGTSAKIHVHVPNAYVGIEEANVEADETYSVPGSELLSWDSLRQFGLDYVEIGPPGWEHIAVLVSEEPLIEQGILARATGRQPFSELNPQEIAELCERLTERPPTEWSVGVLSFLVA